jgi:hypothetical protein
MIRVAPTLLASVVLARLAIAQSPCETTFTSGGSVLGGKIYSVYVDIGTVSVGTAVKRLAKQLPSRKFELVAVDPQRGVVKANGTEMRSTSFDFLVAGSDAGTRVKVVMHLPVGAFAASATKASMCEILTSVFAAQPEEAAADGAAREAPEAEIAEPPARAAAQAEPPAYEPQQAPLTNEEVVRLTRAGLEPDLIVAKIKQAPSESFDVSTDALIALRKQRVNKEVIAAILQRASGRAGGASAQQQQQAKPTSKAAQELLGLHDVPFSAEQDAALVAFLKAHPGYQAASCQSLGLSDASCRGAQKEWEQVVRGVPNAELQFPYLLWGDFNKDGLPDFVVAFFSRAHVNSYGWRNWMLVVFQGAPGGKYVPVIAAKDTWGACFDGMLYHPVRKQVEYWCGSGGGTFRWNGSRYVAERLVGD